MTLLRPFATLVLLAGPLTAMACNPSTEPAKQQLQGVVEGEYGGLPGRPFGIRVAPNGAIFVTQQDRARVTRLAPGDAGPRDSSTVGTDPGDVVLTANGARAIVSTFISGGLHFLDATTGVQTDFTQVGTNAYRLAVSKSGQRVFVTTTGGRVHAIEIATGNKVDSVQLSGSLQGIALRSDGVLAVSSSGGNLTLLDPGSLDVIESRNLGIDAQDIAFSKDGDRLFVAAEGAARLLVVDGRTLVTRDSVLFNGPIGVWPFGLTLSPNGATLLVSSPLSGALALVNAQTLALRTVITLGGEPRRIAFAPDGSRAYVANEADRIDVIR